MSSKTLSNIHEEQELNITLSKLQNQMTNKESNNRYTKILNIIKNYNKDALIRKKITYDFTIYLRSNNKNKGEINEKEVKNLIKYILQIIRKKEPTKTNQEILFTKLPSLLDKYKVLLIVKKTTKIKPI